MAAIEELIKQIADPALRDQLAYEVARLKASRTFGLVFEEHLPELVRLPALPVRVGARVLKKEESGATTYRVISQVNGKKIKIAPDAGGPEEVIETNAVVVAKAFGEPMYPALIPVDFIERDSSKPWHVLINADNYHALQLLLYGYERKVDVIYIDPPYNTGARDWKYNNNYVDRTDQFRHSKWLSMMKKRLTLARRLLRADGVLIVTIDENEFHHLMLLLDSIYPEYEKQAATAVINPGGAFGYNLSSVHEYVIYCIPAGQDIVRGRPLTDEEQGLFNRSDDDGRFVLGRMRKRGIESLRKDRKSMFYAVYVDEEAMQPVEVGPELDLDEKPSTKRKGKLIPVYPIDQNGIERRWSCGRTTMQDEIDAGNVVAQRNRHGIVNIYKKERKKLYRRLNTVWTESEYSAGDYGSRLVNTLLGKANAFPFPKSLYAVRDTIGSVVRERPDAIILDFFAGSATTLHATAMLNREDGGSRRSIIVTNNELNDDRLISDLLAKGIQPGDAEWAAQGICEAATWPRVRASLTGKSPEGVELLGKYIGGHSMSAGFKENAAYFKLDFLDLGDVTRGERFESIVPILWMLSGCRGACEVSKGSGKWFIPKNNPFAVLLNEDAFGEFARKLVERPDIDHVFLVTDSTEGFHEMADQLGRQYKSIQLYRSYVDTFRINLSEPGTITSSGVPMIPAGILPRKEATDAV